MTEYLKFYVLHTFSISPHSSRRTTLLNTKVLNLCIRQVANGVRLRFGTWQQCSEIRFIEPGVKVNGAYYRINLLAQKLYCKTYSGYPRVGFLSVSITAHRSHDTVAFLERKVLYRLHSTNTVVAKFNGF